MCCLERFVCLRVQGVQTAHTEYIASYIVQMPDAGGQEGGEDSSIFLKVQGLGDVTRQTACQGVVERRGAGRLEVSTIFVAKRNVFSKILKE